MVYHRLKDIKNSIYPEAKDLTFIANSRRACEDILTGKSPKLAIIMGPCSIHSKESALSYAEKIQKLSSKVEDHILLVMRVYVEKSRTGIGWKGFAYDPYLSEKGDILTGLQLSRQLLKELTAMQVPVSVEKVDPNMFYFLQDFVTWGFIGARSVSSQIHRQYASNLPFPVGFKNGLDGNALSAIHSIETASVPHNFLGFDEKLELSIIQSKGNPYSHLVLRGSERSTNYDAESILSATSLLKSKGLHSSLVVDCSHGNCQKDYLKQKEVFYNLLSQIESGNENIKGIMLESHIKEGSIKGQFKLPLSHDISVTDPCLSWEDTEALVLDAHNLLSSRVCSASF